MSLNRFKSTLTENVYAAVGVVGSLFFVFVLLLPSFSSIPNLRLQAKTKNDDLKQLKAKSLNLNSLITNQSSLKSSLKIVDNAVPSKDDVPTLMTQIQKIATSSGVTLKALQFGAGTLGTAVGGLSRLAADKNIKRVQLQVVAEGSFVGLQSFLKNVEEASRLISVDNLSFEAKKGGEAIVSTLGLVSFYVDSLPADPNFSFDLGQSDFKSTLLKLKGLKVYEAEVTFSGVGKANPFE